MKSKIKLKYIILIVILVIGFSFTLSNFQCLSRHFTRLISIINEGVKSTDPNWLFATCAQSSAAIVAIIGGFIVSRILALSSKKNGLESEIKELSLKIDSKLKEYKEERIKVIEKNIEYDFNSTFKTLVKEAKEINIDDFVKQRLENNKFTGLNNFLISDLTSEDLYYYYDKVLNLIIEAYEYFDKFTEIPSRNKVNERDDLTKEEKRIYNSVRKYLFNDNNSISINVPKGSILKYLQIHNNTMEVHSRSYEKVINSLNTKKIQYEQLKTRKNELVSRLRNFKNPKGLIEGIIVFSYLTLVGIIIPVAFIPLRINEFSANIKWLIFLLFSSGVGLVLLYMVRSMYNITKINDDLIDDISQE